MKPSVELVTASWTLNKTLIMMILKPSIFSKIYLFSLIIILSIAVFIAFRADNFLNDHSLAEIKTQLDAKLLRVEKALRPGLLRENIIEIREATETIAKIENIGVTVFDWKGSVLADSRDDIDNFDNQPVRTEVHQVLKEGYAFLTRFSPPMASKAVFLARKQEELHETIGSIRISQTLAPLARKRSALMMEIAAITMIFAILAAFPSGVMAWFLAKPINTLRRRAERFDTQQLERNSSVHRQDEIGRLARAQEEMEEKFKSVIKTTSSEKQLSSSILSAMLDGIIALDTQEKIIYMNNKAGEILETDPAQSFNHPLWEVSRKLEIRNEIVRALEGKNTQPVNIQLNRKEGDLFLKLYISQLLDQDQKVSGIVVVLQDVTQLQSLADHRAELVTNVAHEFKTPLTVISGISETLMDDPEMPAGPRKSFIEKIWRQAKKLSELSGDMLELSRIEMNRDGLNRSVSDLRPVFKEAVEAFRNNCKNPDIIFQYNEPEAKMMAEIDPQAIYRVANNLLDNAVKYSPSGGTISVTFSSDQGRHKIFVKDTGLGIEPTEQNKIFQRFYRTDRARSPQIQGTGLGLAIVKNIVEAHSGRVSVTSYPGKGSTFIIDLPAL